MLTTISENKLISSAENMLNLVFSLRRKLLQFEEYQTWQKESKEEGRPPLRVSDLLCE